MKTLKQIKEEVAKEYDFDSYLEMIDYEDGFDICIIDEIAKRHANEQLILHGVVKSLKGKFSDDFLDYVQANAKEHKVESLWRCDNRSFLHINDLYRYWKEKTETF